MFGFLKNLFKKDTENNTSNAAATTTNAASTAKESSNTFKLVAPVAGKSVPLSETPDPVFAQKMAGDGLAMEPTGDVVVAPADGELTLVFQ